MVHDTEMRQRRVRFEFPDDLDPEWTPRHPEVAMAANSVSLLMPHVEPYVVRSVRAVADRLDPDLRERALGFCRQELRHHAEHRRFNDLVIAAHPRLGRVDRWMRRVYSWLGRTRSTEFNLAFAAGSETVAFALARWTEANMRTIFDGADDVVTTLFLWHLAEEVEHKSVAFDVHRAVDGSRWRHLAAGGLSVALLAFFTIVCSAVMLWDTRRVWSPVAWFRLAKWSISLGFEILPDLAASATKGHHPTDFVDPSLLVQWLDSFDPETSTMPLWSKSGASLSPRAA